MTVWQGQWIWSGEEAESSPRNRWQCFRRRFILSGSVPADAVLSITADSRYVAYVNGVEIGNGPARGWTDEPFYDQYEVGHLLRRGENTLAVLVMHYGVSTFYYVKGRGGLLAQLDGAGDSALCTDALWKTRVCPGQDPRAPRMACQQAFTEQIDGTLYNEDWVTGGYDDSGWDFAHPIGKPGTAPWGCPRPRDIPLLAEETVLPVCVESLASYRPVPLTAAIDLRTQLAPDSTSHVQEIGYLAFLATCLIAKRDTQAVLAFPQASVNFGDCWINGVLYQPDPYEENSFFRQFTVPLRRGTNLFVMDVSGYDHGRGFHFGLDSRDPVTLRSPLGESAETAWATAGPMDMVVKYDYAPGRLLCYENAEYRHIRQELQTGNTSALFDYLRPVPPNLVSRADVFVQSTWRPRRTTHPVPLPMQAVCSRMSATLPLYDGESTEIVLDFGSEWSGYIEFEVDTSSGTILDFYGYEYQFDGWRQDTYSLDNTLRYVCREGRQTYRSKVRRGFRYLMLSVTGAARPVRLYSLCMRQSNYPVAEIGRFSCSDAQLEEIWRMGQRTMRICMEDTFVDCPCEQTYWVADARNEALINYSLFGGADIVKRGLRLVPGSRRYTPYYTSHAPTGWANVIPNFTFCWVMACLECYEWSGERSFLEEMWPHICFTLDHYLQKIDAQGLLWMQGWNFLDWAPIDQPDDGIVTHQNAFFCRALWAAAQIGRFLDEPDAALRYAEAADALKEAINRYLWDDARHAYIDCIHVDGVRSTVFSIQTQIVTYAAGIPDEDRCAFLETYLERCPEDFVKSGSPFISFFHYECLMRKKRVDVMLADMRSHYGQMLERGARTCWEMYPTPEQFQNKKIPLTRSHCHAWAAAPCYYLGAYILGVRSVGPGWTDVIVAPEPAGLRWARGTIPLPNGGRVDVAWAITNSDGSGVDCIHIQVGKPSEITVTVQPPPGMLHQVTIESI